MRILHTEEIFLCSLHFFIGAKVPFSERLLQYQKVVEVALLQVETVGRIGKVLPTDGMNDTWTIHFHKPFIDFCIFHNPSPFMAHKSSHICLRLQNKLLSISAMQGLDDSPRLALSAGSRPYVTSQGQVFPLYEDFLGDKCNDMTSHTFHQLSPSLMAIWCMWACVCLCVCNMETCKYY